MSGTQQEHLLMMLLREEGWYTASDLASALGVSARSVRSYVSALNERVDSGVVVESGALGYRAGGAAREAVRDGRERASMTPGRRLRVLSRMLLDARMGIDAHDAAHRFHVSDSTLEADLVKLRRVLAGFSLSLIRRSQQIELVGTENAKRQLLVWVVREESAVGGELILDAVRAEFAPESPGQRVFDSFRHALNEHLQRSGYAVNDLNATDVLLHLAVAIDRAEHSTTLGGATSQPVNAEVRGVSELLSVLALRHLGVRLGTNDADQLAAYLLTRVIATAPSGGQPLAPVVDPSLVDAMRSLLVAVSQEFSVELAQEDLVRRLSLHVQVLTERARIGAWSQNSLTRSLKSSYPLIFDIAVAISAGIRTRLGIEIPDDEIAFIAMHLGAFLERNKWDERRLSAIIVCPGYPETRDLLRASIESALGSVLEVVEVRSSVDEDTESVRADLVLTTSEKVSTSESWVRIQPFLTAPDVDRVNAAASRVHRTKRMLRLREELERYFVPTAFLRETMGRSPEHVIKDLGEMLVRDGAVGEDFVQRVIERERLSSTAFITSVAIPHAIGADTGRTSIAVGIADPSIAWGDSRVQIVLLVAFSRSDRDAFQLVFEQLVEVFSGRDSISRIAKRSTTFPRFLDELVGLIDG